jgi:hypothetical protein
MDITTALLRVEGELPHLRERLRIVKGIRSERDWAAELGLPQQTLNRWKNGAVPSTPMLRRVCFYESVSFEWLAMGMWPMDRDYGYAKPAAYQSLEARREPFVAGDQVAENPAEIPATGSSEARGNTGE